MTFLGTLERAHGNDADQSRPVFVDRLNSRAGEVHYLKVGDQVYYLDIDDDEQLSVASGAQVRVRGHLSDTGILVARTPDGLLDVAPVR